MTMDTIRTRKDVADSLSQTLDTEVVPAKSADLEYGNTLIFADVDGGTQAYVADGAVQNEAQGKLDYVLDAGLLEQDGNLGATAGQYHGEIPDNVATMYEADIAVMGDKVQGRDGSTAVSLESSSKEPGDGFIERALDEGEFRQY